MANYLLIYHGGGDMPEDPAVLASEMEAWTNWFAQIGPAVVDGGNPVGRNWTITAEGTTEDGGPNPATGYSVISADSMQRALELSLGCPALANGGSIELCETFDV